MSRRIARGILHPMGERVLLTGASSGIGLELAKLFAAEGCDLVIVARRREQLVWLAEELTAAHGVRVAVFAADLAAPDAAQQLCDALAADGLTVDVLVNNAGFGLRGRFHELPLDRQLAMVRLNVGAVVDLTHRLVGDMVARRRGGILNVASVAGFQPGPGMAIYFATKAFLLSFSEAVYEELRGTGVTVSCLCPGPTTTEFQQLAALEGEPPPRAHAMSAAAVAAAGHRGFRAGKAVVVPGLLNKAGTQGVRFAPRSLVRRIAARLA